MALVDALPYNAALDAIDDATVLFRTGRSGPRVLHVNRRGAELWRRPAHEVAGKPLTALFSWLAPSDQHTVRAAIDDRQGVEVPAHIRGRPWHLRLTPVEDRVWIGVLKDLTPLHDLEATLLDRAYRDGLTGLWNRQAWTEQAQAHFDAARQDQRPLSLLLLDLDHFKRINDTFGHPVGDAVLQAVCGACRGAVRRTDLVGRLGGEELAVLAPDTGLAGASTLGVRVCNAVRRVRVSSRKGPVQVTVSAGVAERSTVDADLAGLIARADAALYRAKAEGRDRVVIS